MAKLDYIEIHHFENLFQKYNGPGYVLNFSNNSFKEFVLNIIDINVYKNYPNLSKMKILKSIIRDYDDITVGKLLLSLLRYMKECDLLLSEDEPLFNKCAIIANRLIGRKVPTNISINTPSSKQPTQQNFINYDELLSNLQKLTNYPDSPQKRGYEFEKYLKNLFNTFDLDARGSFKLIGEQIDGSFVLDKNIYLLGAKWTNKKIERDELVIFNDKVSSKSGFTRGLFISFSGYSDEALQTIHTGRTINIILMTVAELSIALSRKLDLKTVLWKKVRALAEEGNCNKSIFEI